MWRLEAGSRGRDETGRNTGGKANEGESLIVSGWAPRQISMNLKEEEDHHDSERTSSAVLSKSNNEKCIRIIIVIVHSRNGVVIPASADNTGTARVRVVDCTENIISYCLKESIRKSKFRTLNYVRNSYFI